MRHRRYLVFLNSFAGSCAKVSNLEQRIRKGLGDGLDAKVEILHTNSPEQAARFALLSRKKRWDAIITVGGDGTHHWVVDGIAEGKSPLGLIPLGTANDLAQEFGIPGQVEDACQVIREGCQVRIDLLQTHGKCFATAGGVGLATDVAMGVAEARTRSHLFHWLMRLIGGSIYTLYMLFMVLFARNLGYRFVVETAEGERREVDAYMALVLNQASIGQDFHAAPGASNRDGQFEVLLIKKQGRFPRLKLILTLVQSTRGKHVGRPDVELFRASRLTLKTRDPAIFFADGEVLAEEREFEFTLRPRALPLIVPASRAETLLVGPPSHSSAAA